MSFLFVGLAVAMMRMCVFMCGSVWSQMLAQVTTMEQLRACVADMAQVLDASTVELLLVDNARQELVGHSPGGGSGGEHRESLMLGVAGQAVQTRKVCTSVGEGRGTPTLAAPILAASGQSVAAVLRWRRRQVTASGGGGSGGGVAFTDTDSTAAAALASHMEVAMERMEVWRAHQSQVADMQTEVQDARAHASRANLALRLVESMPATVAAHPGRGVSSEAVAANLSAAFVGVHGLGSGATRLLLVNPDDGTVCGVGAGGVTAFVPQPGGCLARALAQTPKDNDADDAGGDAQSSAIVEFGQGALEMACPVFDDEGAVCAILHASAPDVAYTNQHEALLLVRQRGWLLE